MDLEDFSGRAQRTTYSMSRSDASWRSPNRKPAQPAAENQSAVAQSSPRGLRLSAAYSIAAGTGAKEFAGALLTTPSRFQNCCHARDNGPRGWLSGWRVAVSAGGPQLWTGTMDKLLPSKTATTFCAYPQADVHSGAGERWAFAACLLLAAATAPHRGRFQVGHPSSGVLTRWQAASPPSGAGRKSGRRRRQASNTYGQRGWNGQPGGIATALGSSPRTAAARERLVGSRSGAAASRAWV